ncbi:MAG: aryl-sulfate sulfotransferase [Saccharofermentanales bacterium]|jgi:arylsulfate sulfotransferase
MKKIRMICVLLAALFVLSSCAGTPTKKEPVIAEDLAVFSVEGKTDLPGNFYLSFVCSRDLVMLDGEGNIVWSKHEEPIAEDVNTGFWDFKKHTVGEQTYYSYHDQTGTYDDYGLQGFAPGERVILDENFNEIKRITFEQSSVVGSGHPLDGHDFLMIDLDHYILSGYIKDIVTNVPGYTNGSSVVYSYLQEVKNGEVVWDWKSVDYPELYALTVTDASETAKDYANETTDIPDIIHFNSMQLDEDSNLICSFRHINSILCLDRTKKTEQIQWILSGEGDQFGLSEIQKTSSQHYACLDGDGITIFDNGNRNKSSRVVFYRLDEENKRLKDFRSYTLGGKFSYACGSAQRIKDDLYVIGWGWATGDADCMSVYDFTTGEALMTVTLGNPQNLTYRCVYYD